MRKLIITLCLIVSAHCLFAQNAEPAIEIHLSLLERNNALGGKQLALSVSLINHSNKDIYIPNFLLFGSYSGIHVYQKENEDWHEIDIATHDYYRPIVQSTTIKRGDTIFHYNNERHYYITENDLTKSFDKHSLQLNRQQDSLIKSFYYSAPDHHQLTIFSILEQKPLFLKANQTLDNYIVRNFDYLLTKKMDYKISFNTEVRDTIGYYSKPKLYSKQLKKYEELHFPDHIYNYELFFPGKILSNTIYYSSKKD